MTTYADTERLDLESASSAYRRRRCPGSANLCRALREAGKLTQRFNPDTASGSKVHSAWSGAKVNDLTPKEADTLEGLRRMEAMLVTDWAGGEEIGLLGREQRLWLHHRLDPVHSGAFDVAYGTVGTPRRMLILDGKTLYGEVTPAEENDQLRELVALARFNFPKCSEFTVAILQPLVSGRPSVAVYDEIEAELAVRELKRTLADNADPDAPRTAGQWCEHCPALEYCDTARGLTMHTTDLAKQIEAGEFSLPVGLEGSRLLEAARLGQKWIDAMIERYKAVLAQTPDALPGWTLKNGRKVREITDVAQAMRIAPEFMTLEEFYSAASLNVGALQVLVARATKLSGRALDELFNNRFGSVLHYKTQAPMLVRDNKGAK